LSNLSLNGCESDTEDLAQVAFDKPAAAVALDANANIETAPPIKALDELDLSLSFGFRPLTAGFY
jgi:hypothetical protein